MANGSPHEHFVQKESNRPILDAPLAKIPVIDISYAESNDLGQRELEDIKLRSALSSEGLFHVLGHGIQPSLMEEVRNVIRLFFKQPFKEKQSCTTSDTQIPDFKAGYGDDVVISDEQTTYDWNEKLLLNVYPKETRDMDVWPQKPESFRETIYEFNEKMVIIADVILKALARTLGLDEFYFIKNGTKGRMVWRFNYYPSCSTPDLVLGMRAHSDGSSFTILLQDNQVPGFQVFNNEFGWLNVPILPNSLLVVLGDEIEIMSNGRYKSIVHKIVTNSEKERISLAMFVLSELENELGPIDELIEEGKPSLYKKIKVKDYGDAFFLKFTQGKRAIDLMRI